jgi:branched-chain amino acid transport system ATP-binding protein
MLEATNLMVFYENMLALNNVNIRCDENRIVGVFGANSAGKSTLMYTLSGIMEDIRKKEEMAGGERITVVGRIRYKGEDISAWKPSRRARNGLILCPERRRIFKESNVLENLRIGGYLATGSGQTDHGVCFQAFSRSRKVEEEGGRIFERRRAANAGHRPGAHGTAELASP